MTQGKQTRTPEGLVLGEAKEFSRTLEVQFAHKDLACSAVGAAAHVAAEHAFPGLPAFDALGAKERADHVGFALSLDHGESDDTRHV